MIIGLSPGALPQLKIIAEKKPTKDWKEAFSILKERPYFAPTSVKTLFVWKNSTQLLSYYEKETKWAEEEKFQLHSATLSILGEISVLTMIFPCHPCSDALWITDDPLCAFYSLSDVILQQNVAGYTTGVNCFRGFAIVTPVAAIDLKYPIISALASRIVVCSSCVITAFPLGQTHPVWQADSLEAIHAKSFQSSG